MVARRSERGCDHARPRKHHLAAAMYCKLPRFVEMPLTHGERRLRAKPKAPHSQQAALFAQTIVCTVDAFGVSSDAIGRFVNPAGTVRYRPSKT